MQFTVVIAAALLGAVPVFAGQKAWCPNAGQAAVERGCGDNRIPLSQGDHGTCCLTSKQDYSNMVNVCFAVGSKPALGADC